jgi:hypothetical protein
MFNAIIKDERVSKARVKNLLAAPVDVVPLDEKAKLKKYTREFRENPGMYRITYQRPEFKTFGRITETPYTGIGTFCKSVRGYLARGVYVDVDMVNCHPRILLHELKAIHADYTDLEEYINDRPGFLAREGVHKEDVLKMINKEDYESSSPAMMRIHRQIYERLVPSIIERMPGMNDQIKKSRLRNRRGVLVANFLQDREFAILQALDEFCTARSIPVDVYMHDGFFVRLTPEVTEAVVEEFLPRFTEVVSEKFGFEMQFKTKPHDISLVDLIDNDGASEYSKMKREFEQDHCKIINKSLFVKETDTGYTLFTSAGLSVSYAHLNVVQDGKQVPFTYLWTRDSTMRLYTDMNCYPKAELCPPDVFNTWKPFRAEGISGSPELGVEGRDMILNHIRILCGNETLISEWFERFIGHMLVFPERKTPCPVLISKQGGGKGRLLDFMRQLLGSSKVFETTSPDRDVWGNFNGRMKDCFLVNVNELSKKSTFDSMGKIKGLITDEELIINEKGVAQYSIKSHHRFIITTNSDDPIETGYDDRRFLIIRSSDEKVGDSAYFTRLMDHINDDNVIVACREYFTSLEGLDRFHSEKLPTTAYQDNLRENSFSPVELWVRDVVCSWTKKDVYTLSCKELYDSFMRFCGENGIHYEVSSVKLGVKLSNLNLPGVATVRTGTSRGRSFDVEKLRKHYGVSKTMFVEE